MNLTPTASAAIAGSLDDVERMVDLCEFARRCPEGSDAQWIATGQANAIDEALTAKARRAGISLETLLTEATAQLAQRRRDRRAA